jgi:hypothetical protein
MRSHSQSGNKKICVMIEGILESWLHTQPDAPAPPVGAGPTVVPAPAASEPRPTYSERRKQQIADGATPIPAKKAKKIRLAWVPCRPAEFLDSENGPKQMQQNSKFAAKFYSEADAIAAEQKNFEQVGYREEVKECAVCSGGNARKKCWHVFHIYRTELEGKQ